MRRMLEVVNKTSENSFRNSGDAVRNFLKNFNILHPIGYVDESWNEVKTFTLIWSWHKLLPAAKQQSPPEETVGEVVNRIMEIARYVGSEGFSDVAHDEVLELVQPNKESFSVEEIKGILY